LNLQSVDRSRSKRGPRPADQWQQRRLLIADLLTIADIKLTALYHIKVL